MSHKGRLLLTGSIGTLALVSATAALAQTSTGPAIATVAQNSMGSPNATPSSTGAAAAAATASTQSVDQAKAAEITSPTDQSSHQVSEVVVTGSRIQRAGFNAPTPTTVIGAAELRQGDRPSLAQVLDDLPQFRATSTPATTTGNTNNSASTADLRGLGAVRTLTLLDGHRFTGSNDLNTIPQSIIKRVDVVTGGASAAWGSGAVSGVVNIILDDDFMGLAAGADGGVSDRSDAARYGFNATYGTRFAGGRGHFMIAGDYLKDEGAFGRASRPNLDAAIFQQANGQLILANNVNYTVLNTGGVIQAGPAARYVFNPDGSLSPLQLGSQTVGSFTVGGNGQNLYNYVAVTSPYQRANVFSRTSFDINSATKVWVDASYSRVWSNFPFFPETPSFTVRADNPYLTPTARAQLAALGATLPISVGRLLTDVGPEGYLGYRSVRRNLEGAVGVDGSLGGSWKYSVYYDHGELRNDQSVYNQRITAKFNRAIDAVAGPNGTPTCRVNADAITTNDDPACVPIDLLGSGKISAAGIAYAFGSNRQITTTKLDATGVSLHGQPFSTWAGPVDLAVGGDFRWESLKTDYVDPISLAGGFSSLNFSPTSGSFDVKEGFGELNVPLLNIENLVHVEANGAARYSDYSTSGGIWSWKYGGTARVFSDLLLRGTYSRDIRSPTIIEYFTTRATNITSTQDPFRGQPQANVVNYTGGNPALAPEISHTMTLGGSYLPRQVQGLSLSVDYYTIDIKNAIATLTLQDVLNACYARNPADPTCGGLIARTPTGTIDSVTRTYLNLQEYKTRGVDFEASYVMPLDRLIHNAGGTIRIRALATHVIDLLINDGVRITNRAGVVGDTTTFSTPKWRATGGVTYQGRALTVDLRVRYVDGGVFSSQLGANGQPILNNQVGSRAYADVGVQYTLGPVTLYGTVDNLFDRGAPYVTYATPIYDMIGRYYSGGVKVKF